MSQFGLIKGWAVGCAARVPKVVRLTQAALIAMTVVYGTSLLVRDRSGFSAVFEGVVMNVALALCGVLCLLRAVSERADRPAFALLGVGGLIFTAGNVAYVTHVQYLDPFPVPNVSDLGYLGIYPCLVAAVLLLGGRSPRQFGVWLDGLVGALGVAAVGAALVLHTTLAGLSSDPVALVVAASYSFGDLLVLSIVVGVLTVRGQRMDRRWCALALGLVGFAIADIVYLLRLSTGSYEQGTFLDALWLIGLALVSLSAWQPTQTEAPRGAGARSLIVTIVSSVLAMAVLVCASMIQVASYAVVLASATLLAGLLRAVVAFHQVRHLAEERARAGTDELTGLPNRRIFTSAVRDALARPEDREFAILLLDLDGFKEVNDLFGHPAGDQVLREAGRRLFRVLRPGDLVARVGGDEFGFVVQGADQATAVAVAHRVRACLRPPFVIDDITHNMSGTIGIGLCPTHAEDADRLFACADVAISTAKSNSSGVEVYDRLKGLDVAHRLATARQLRVAVASGQFVLHYQPKVDIRSGAVVGVEALVRWEHPDDGLQYPDSFLPIVEQIGCMPALTRLVLEAAISQRREWYLDGIALTMAVNLSASNLDDPDLVTDIALMLVGAGVPSDALELEITETNLMIDPLQAKTTLEALHALGIGLSVDDYGTGFSSLQYIRDLPVHELKIDRTFVTGMSDDDRNRAIVRSTIQLGHALGLRVVGEGVETRDDLALLERLGCDSAQGYYLCKPWPAAQLSRWLHANHSQSDAVL